MALKAEQGAGVVAVNLRIADKILVTLVAMVLILSALSVKAGVLPEDRLDVMYFNYAGGGMDIDGPTVLVRKKIGEKVSVTAHHLVDMVSGASIDVEMISGASKISEERTENSVSVDYLHHKTTFSLSHQTSEENDFDAATSSFNVSQDFFGDLTSLSLGYSRGRDEIGMSTTPGFRAEAKRQHYRIALNQVMSKYFIVNFSHESITDEGFLRNPYRKVRFLSDAPLGFSLEDELYPNTRTSRAYAIRGKYYLPYRAALRAEYRVFTDSWGISAFNYDIGYAHPFSEQWTLDVHYRFYHQDAADFYQDIFDRPEQFEFRARDKELSTFDDISLGFGVTYQYKLPGLSWLDRGEIHLFYDYIQFQYEDFRDARAGGTAGAEPLYEFTTSATRLIFSWYF